MKAHLLALAAGIVACSGSTGGTTPPDDECDRLLRAAARLSCRPDDGSDLAAKLARLRPGSGAVTAGLSQPYTPDWLRDGCLDAACRTVDPVTLGCPGGDMEDLYDGADSGIMQMLILCWAPRPTAVAYVTCLGAAEPDDATLALICSDKHL
jgi:hypothetical protein